MLVGSWFVKKLKLFCLPVITSMKISDENLLPFIIALVIIFITEQKANEIMSNQFMKRRVD